MGLPSAANTHPTKLLQGLPLQCHGVHAGENPPRKLSLLVPSLGSSWGLPGWPQKWSYLGYLGVVEKGVLGVMAKTGRFYISWGLARRKTDGS